MTRLRAAGGALLASLAISSSCGVCLLVTTTETRFTTRDGESIRAMLSFRPTGIGETIGEAARTFPINLFFEVLDDAIFTPYAGLRCLLRSDESIDGGFLGWLAALTPFATLSPGPYSFPPFPVGIDDDTLGVLRGPDDEERHRAVRALFPNQDVRDIVFR